MERGWSEISPNCPRCGSSNTKFCYYNNYSLTQPRYFCKGCRRYWTKGGSLRNVPIGGGCRKSRRSRSSTLRLATSNPHHHGLSASRSTSNSIFGHGAHNNSELGHGYASPNGNLTNIVQPTCSSMNSEPPAIDLAVVYANFLSQKPENLDSMVVKLPNDESAHLGPSSQAMLQQEHTNIVNCTNDPPFTQGLPIMPHMSDEDDHSQMFLTEFSRPIHLHHHHGEISIQGELVGLPPLPGESLSQEHNLVPWTPSTLSNNDQHSNLQPPRVLPDMESDSQLSNLFVGSWSPLDLPGFETSSSSSKP